MSALGHHHIPFLTHLKIPLKPVYPRITVVTKENPYFESEDKILQKVFQVFTKSLKWGYLFKFTSQMQG